MAALRARLALRATVIRDGTEQDVAARELVLGDLVVLNAGDIVPADGRLMEANHLYVDESAMTGESAPALKVARDGERDPTVESDRDAFVFFGTSVVSGAAKAVLTATGADTSYGLIARRLIEAAPQNDFERGVRSFGLLIARVILLLVVAVLAINVALGRPLIESLLFAIALAVGLTPELLPAIVTVNLSRGARVLAARGVLVKRLPAIQNLGSMTILCTDKTGTLTEGRLTLERAQRPDGGDAPTRSGSRTSTATSRRASPTRSTWPSSPPSAGRRTSPRTTSWPSCPSTSSVAASRCWWPGRRASRSSSRRAPRRRSSSARQRSGRQPARPLSTTSGASSSRR